MKRIPSFAGGVAAGVVLAVAAGAWADWNGSPAGSTPDRQALERLARASEDAAQRLGEIARSSAEGTRAQESTARAIESLGRRCR
jgi:hypothetical protein